MLDAQVVSLMTLFPTTNNRLYRHSSHDSTIFCVLSIKILSYVGTSSYLCDDIDGELWLTAYAYYL